MGEGVSSLFCVGVGDGFYGSGSDFVCVFEVGDLGEGGSCVVVEVAFLSGEVFFHFLFSVLWDVVF